LSGVQANRIISVQAVLWLAVLDREIIGSSGGTQSLPARIVSHTPYQNRCTRDEVELIAPQILNPKDHFAPLYRFAREIPSSDFSADFWKR
jgi:hypothetical protein